MLKKLLAASLLLSAFVAQAAPEHRANAKAYQDQNGRDIRGCPGLKRHLETKGVPQTWPFPGEKSNRYHLKESEQ